VPQYRYFVSQSNKFYSHIICDGSQRQYNVSKSAKPSSATQEMLKMAFCDNSSGDKKKKALESSLDSNARKLGSEM
jgi:hypothetical protein